MATSDHPQGNVPEDDQGLSTGQVCKRLRLTRSKLRHWERIGVVQPSRIRCRGRQWRRYNAANVDLLRRITYLVSEGMTIRGASGKAEKLAEMEKERGKPFEAPIPEAGNAEVSLTQPPPPVENVSSNAAVENTLAPVPEDVGAGSGETATAGNPAVQETEEESAKSGGLAAGNAAEPEDYDWLR